MEASKSHQADLAASESRIQQESALHAAMLADVTAAHKVVLKAAQEKCFRAEVAIESYGLSMPKRSPSAMQSLRKLTWAGACKPSR